jgi:hypothetical protein
MNQTANKTMAERASSRVEEVRLALREHADLWDAMVGMNGIETRWIRAFATGQINQPPANRFLALERFLMDRRLLTRRLSS